MIALFLSVYVILTCGYLLHMLAVIVPESLTNQISGKWIAFLAVLVCAMGTHKGMQRRGRMAGASGGLYLAAVILLMVLTAFQGRKDYLVQMIEDSVAARREHGTIVAMACHEPEESCFCKVFGTDAADPVADVAVWMIGEELFWKAVTEKGNALTESVKELLQDADAADEEAVSKEKEAIRTIIEKLPYTHLSLEGWDGNATEEKFNSPVWNELYKPCLACGTCTFVCPTCQCYDIKDYDTGHGVKRYRCWDSCMYSDFTLMAGGNNRTTQLQRFRQRFMHKLVYFPANNDGMYSCVGCGRCVEKCPEALNIVKVIKAFEKQGGEKA